MHHPFKPSPLNGGEGFFILVSIVIKAILAETKSPQLKGRYSYMIHQNISPERMKELSEIMVHGNIIAKEVFSDYMDKGILGRHDYRSFRQMIGWNRPGRLTKKQISKMKLSKMPTSKKKAIKLVSDVQNEITEGYVRLCLKYGGEQRLSSAALYLIDAIYNYSDLKIKFITYATHAIKYGLMREKKQEIKHKRMVMASQLPNYDENICCFENVFGYYEKEHYMVDLDVAKTILSSLSPFERDAFISKHVYEEPLRMVGDKHSKSNQAAYLALERAEKKIRGKLSMQS